MVQLGQITSKWTEIFIFKIVLPESYLRTLFFSDLTLATE